MARTADTYYAGHSTLLSEPASVVALGFLTAIPGFIIIWVMSAPVLLPAFGLAWLVNAGCASLLAWSVRFKRRTDYVNLWDIAGAYALIGFALGMISKPDDVLQLFGLAAPAR